MPQDPSICMLRMQCTLQLHTMLTTLTQYLPDQSKFASYTPDAAIALMTVRLPIDLVEKTPTPFSCSRQQPDNTYMM